MNKNMKKILAIVIIIISCFVAYKIVDTISYHIVEKMAVSYLCEKYDAKSDEFKLIDSREDGFYLKDVGLFFDELHWNEYAFEFEYNNRQFFVNRYNRQFYDDYQLDDIEKWCTEWLQNNVNDKIIGVSLETEDINYYYKKTEKNSKYIITENDTEDFFIKAFGTYEIMVFWFQSEEDISNEIIKNTFCEKLGVQKKVNVVHCDMYRTIKKIILTNENDTWSYWIGVY